MPKAPMSKEEIENARERILDTALEIIINEGFQNLSVRKIASRLGVTATTIYNYYTNKDEINLMIRIRGFEKLYDMLIHCSAPFNKIEDKLKAMVHTYIDFGLTYPSYYDIMFNLHTPKYLDYVGTSMESMAYIEKQNALKCLSVFMEPISTYIPIYGKRKDNFIQYQTTKCWSDLHGLVTLTNSRLFHEVVGDVDSFVKEREAEIIEYIKQYKESFDKGDKLF